MFADKAKTELGCRFHVRGNVALKIDVIKKTSKAQLTSKADRFRKTSETEAFCREGSRGEIHKAFKLKVASHRTGVSICEIFTMV